jgi:FAD/FMN-containing dehydrogenase
MTVIDFNIHLPPEGDFSDERDFRRFDAMASMKAIDARFQEQDIDAANIMILDTDLLRRDPGPLLNQITSLGHHATLMIDPRDDDAHARVEQAAQLGASGIKFHPYFLGLESKDFGLAVSVARKAERHGLWVAVCNSYGTKDVYRIRPVELLIAICNEVSSVPVISLHAGGARILDVMSAAFDFPNLLLETSFSLPFWVGSSVETDFVFVLRKLGMDRWIYGSDHPHVDLKSSLESIRAFCARHDFSESEQAQLLSGTAQQKLGMKLG